jgi:glycosyltransferase involved in cell wall biosynthesis
MTLKQTKRIGMLVARDNFVYRGVGAYAKSIIDWALGEGYYIDIISDAAVRDNGLFNRYIGQVQWIQPKHYVDDRVYKELSSFSKPFNTALSLNFRNSLVEALRKHTYDLIITNVGEALDAVTGIGVHKYCRVLHATHHESEAGLKVLHDIFSPGVTDHYRALCNLPDVNLACQSNWVAEYAKSQYNNKDESEILVIPPLIPEPELLDFSTLPRERWGVGFIGPWEPRKNPEAYIAALKASGLPGVVLVPSETSAKKFKERFEREGIEYKIHVGVTGAEKTKIIQSLGAAYHPAVSETFGLGALETAHTCPTILLKSNEWSIAHEDYAIIIDESEVADKLKKVYGIGVTEERKSQLLYRDTHIRNKLNKFAERPKLDKVTKNNFYTALEDKGIIKHEEFTAEQASFCTDEIYKVLRLPAIDGVEILHSYNTTYYRNKGSNLLPDEASSPVDSLFTFE